MTGPNALTGAEIDRAEDHRRRDDDWLAAQRADPRARAVVLGDAGVRARDGAIERVPLDAIDAGREDALLLGLDAQGPLFVVDEDPPRPGRRAPLVGAGGPRGEPAPDAPDRVGLRTAAQVLPQADGGLVAYAAGLLNWHRNHRHCAVCGAPTAVGEGGILRSCGACGTTHHPRTDPVVIMLVVDEEGDRVLLGRQETWPARRYSALAGFVSPGESLEEAVAREVREEASVRVGVPRYAGSQPWPFPASLMIGFLVPWAGEEIRVEDELEDARWFGRDAVAAAAALDDHDTSWERPPPGDGLVLPPRSAIARRLVEDWLAG